MALLRLKITYTALSLSLENVSVIRKPLNRQISLDNQGRFITSPQTILRLFSSFGLRHCSTPYCGNVVVLQNQLNAGCPQRKYSRTEAKAQERKEANPIEEDDEPVKFSTSKAASWSVDESFGKRHQRPYRTVIPISLSVIAILAWAFLRSETEVDRQLEVGLTERLPAKFSEKDVKQFQPLPDWTKTLREKEQKNSK